MHACMVKLPLAERKLIKSEGAGAYRVGANFSSCIARELVP